MKFWSLLSQVEDEQLIGCAVYCEELGFDAVGVSDHAFIPETIQSRYPASPDGRPFFTIEQKWSFPEPWVALAMIAGATRRINLMQSIYVLPLRDPIEVAKSTGTLAALSGNRLKLCAGVGWMKEEFDVYGVDFTQRGKRTDEMIAVMRALWTGEIVEHRGVFFDFPRMRILPAPGHVPIIGAGPSPAAMRRAAGREHLPFEIVMILNGEWDVDAFRRAEDYGVTAIQLLTPFYHYQRRTSLDEKRCYLDSFAEKILRHFQ